MPFEGGGIFAGGRVPEFDSLVTTCRCQGLAIRAERHGRDLIDVPLERSPQLRFLGYQGRNCWNGTGRRIRLVFRNRRKAYQNGPARLAQFGLTHFALPIVPDLLLGKTFHRAGLGRTPQKAAAISRSSSTSAFDGFVPNTCRTQASQSAAVSGNPVR